MPAERCGISAGNMSLTMEDVRDEVQRCATEMVQRELAQLSGKLQDDLEKVLVEGLHNIRQEMGAFCSARKSRRLLSSSFSSCASSDVQELFDPLPRHSLAQSLEKEQPMKKSIVRSSVSRRSRLSQSSQENAPPGQDDFLAQASYVDVLNLWHESRRFEHGGSSCVGFSFPAVTGHSADVDVLEIVPRLLSAPASARFIFWTGGFDSTFRVLQAVLVERRPVVPVYLTGAIDNFSRNSHRRRSGSFELEAMHAITAALKQNYPEARALLQDVISIPEVVFERKCLLSMRKLHAENIVRRKRCQYGAMAQFSLDFGMPLDVSVVEGDFLHKNLQDHMEVIDGELQVSAVAREKLPELAIFRLLRFPLMNYSKESILQEARERGYEAMLQMTWSCWFPRKAGQPCQRCAMCKHRIL